jgi:ureidoacrylate peracid hydrolase
MHKARLPAEFLAAAKARRGDAGYRLDPSKTALIVVDMQNAFVAPGAPLEVPAARGIVDNINRLAQALRQAGGKVVWVMSTMPQKDSARDWIYLSDFLASANRETVRAALRPGSVHHELWPQLDRQPGDLASYKDRFSPFSPGASDLDARLKDEGIREVIVTGTLTNVCCECTARDAMMLNYRVIVPEDANAAGSVARLFAEVVTCDELIDRIVTRES